MKENEIRLPELLAPAGSVTALKAVTAAGADAVYIGGARFGARAYADNPDEEALLDAIDYAHLRGVKVYMTVNTLLKETELEELCSFVEPYYLRGVDAVLVQDFGVMRRLHRVFPDLPLHASTQMTVTGPESVRFLKEYGLTRVVPARELSIEELAAIRAEGLEVETFIHGALCVCYSGQCLYSSLIGGRSGNRGRCAQPCRLLYLKGETGFDGSHSILEEKDARHFLSPKDLMGIRMIPDLVRAGIDSLKIEGRMKQPEYAAGVVSVYRKYLDLFREDPSGYRVSEEDVQLLWDLYNRSGFTDGYFRRRRGASMMAFVKHELTAEETARRHALYEEMHGKYIDREKTVPVTVCVSVKADEAVSAEFSSGGKTAFVTGPEASPAKSQPLNAGRIAECFSKTGGSDFSPADVTVDTDGLSFVPVRQLNGLRRDGLSALRTELLKSSRRAAAAAADNSNAGPAVINADQDKARGGRAESENRLSLSALAASEEQLDMILREKAVDMVWLESSLLMKAETAADPLDMIRRTAAAGKTCGVAGPYIDRGGKPEIRFRSMIPSFLEAGASAVLVRSFETLCALIREGYKDILRADAGIYTFNHEAVQYLRELGITQDTAPLELNRKELFRRGRPESEIIVYGRLPLMVTVQCLKANTESCTHAFARTQLTDRMGMKFTVGCDCVFCYNIILNSVPLNLLSEFGDIKRMGFRRVRLSFTTEDAARTKQILDSAAAAKAMKPAAAFGDNYTKGHYLRGVE